jgi:hypothetical protein
MPKRPPAHGTEPRRFDVQRAGTNGYEVIDFDGRPVAHRRNEGRARACAHGLNGAARAGSRTLERELATAAAGESIRPWTEAWSGR